MTKNRQKQDGFVLITVLMIIAILSALLLRFNMASRNDLNAASRFTGQAQALNCARAGLNIAMAAIAKNPDITTNLTLRKMLHAESSFDIQSGKCTLSVIPENGKLNINTLCQKNGKIDRTRIDQFLHLIDLLNAQAPQSQQLRYSLAPAIIDWTDPDSDVTVLPFIKRDNRGAESNNDQNTQLQYPCKNGPFETLDELLFVRHVTAEMLYPDPNPTGKKTVTPKLADLLTVFGDGKIDINAAPPLVLQALAESVTAAMAHKIVQQRKQTPWATIQEMKNTPGLSDAAWQALSRTITVKPEQRYYTIIAKGATQNAQKTITAIVRRNTASQTMEIIRLAESR